MEKRLLQIFWSGKVRGSAERYNSGSYTVTSKLVLTKRIFSCQLTLSQLFLLHISFASLALRNTETQLHTVFTAGDPQITSCSITSEHYLEASGGKQQINIWVTEWVNTFTRSLLYFTQSSKFKILFSKIHFQHLVWLPFSKKEWQLLEKTAQSDKQSVKKGQLQLNSSISHHTVMEAWWKALLLKIDSCSLIPVGGVGWAIWWFSQAVSIYCWSPPPKDTHSLCWKEENASDTQRSSPVRGVHRCGGKAGNSCRRDEIWGHRLHESKT